jgi:hypothetical protein
MVAIEASKDKALHRRIEVLQRLSQLCPVGRTRLPHGLREQQSRIVALHREDEGAWRGELRSEAREEFLLFVGFRIDEGTNEDRAAGQVFAGGVEKCHVVGRVRGEESGEVVDFLHAPNQRSHGRALRPHDNRIDPRRAHLVELGRHVRVGDGELVGRRGRGGYSTAAVGLPLAKARTESRATSNLKALGKKP